MITKLLGRLGYIPIGLRPLRELGEGTVGIDGTMSNKVRPKVPKHSRLDRREDELKGNPT